MKLLRVEPAPASLHWNWYFIIWGTYTRWYSDFKRTQKCPESDFQDVYKCVLNAINHIKKLLLNSLTGVILHLEIQLGRKTSKVMACNCYHLPTISGIWHHFLLAEYGSWNVFAHMYHQHLSQHSFGMWTIFHWHIPHFLYLWITFH